MNCPVCGSVKPANWKTCGNRKCRSALGGRGNRGRTQPESERERRRGRPVSDETRAKIGEANSKPKPPCPVCGEPCKSHGHATCGNEACVKARNEYSVTARWDDPEKHEQMSARQSKRYLDPEERLKVARAITLTRSGRTISRTEFLHTTCPICSSDGLCQHKKTAWAWALTMDEYLELFKRGCPCGRPLPIDSRAVTQDLRVVIDHDHNHNCPPTPGRKPSRHGCHLCIRGLMHSNCNVLVGMAGDSSETLRKLADYLDRAVVRQPGL
jgi:hypothetical protein